MSTKLEDTLVADKGLGEDRTNGATASRRRQGRKSKGGKSPDCPREGKGSRNSEPLPAPGGQPPVSAQLFLSQLLLPPPCAAPAPLGDLRVRDGGR